MISPDSGWVRPTVCSGVVSVLLILRFPLGFYLVFFKIFYLFIDRGEWKEKERERNINVWLTRAPPTGDLAHNPQAHDLTGNQTRDPLVFRPALNPLSHTSLGSI